MLGRASAISVLLTAILALSVFAQAPGPVTNLTATPLVGGQCLLTWTNPSAPSYAGCTIVINGDHYPSAPNIGDGFAYEVPAPENSHRNHPVMDNHDYRWRLGRKYFYRVWAHDASNNYSTAAQAEVTMSADYVLDDFEGYSTGQLQTVGINHSVLGERDGDWLFYGSPQNNVDQITVVSGNAHSGSKAVRVRNIPGNNLEARVQFSMDRSMKTNFGDIQDGINIARLSFWFKSLTNVGDNFWVVTFRDWQGPNDDAFGMVRGSDNKLQFLNTANGVSTTLAGEKTFTPNVWHHCEIVADTRLSGRGSMLADYYLDGYCVATGTHTGNGGTAKVRCMELWQYQRPAETNDMSVLIDDISLGVAPRRAPIVTGPTGLIIEESPSVTWVREDPNVAFAGQLPPPLHGPYIDPASVSAHQVRICFADDPNDPYPAYDSGETPGGGLSHACDMLPWDIYLWAFVREKTNSGWGPWSRAGAGPFVIVFGECLGPPIITGPNTPYLGGRPLLTFIGCPHDTLRIRAYASSVDPDIATDPVYESGTVGSVAFACPVGPLAGGSYYLYLQLGGAAGWGSWSPGYHLTINRDGECVDTRHMNESNILTTNQPAPSDGFGFPLGGFDEGTCTAALSAAVCNDRMMVVTDNGGASGRLLRQHKIESIDLDKGVTVVAAASVSQGGGDTSGGLNWRQASLLVGDRGPTGEFRLCGVKLRNNQIGLCSLDATGTTSDGIWPLSYTWPVSTDIRVIRLTGHNTVPGDYSSTVWKLYVNEEPTPKVTSTATMTGSAIEADAGYRAGWGTQDFIALGQGSTNITGTFRYDWVAVNGSGDYAPGEWDPFSGSGSYPTISGAKLRGAESRAVSVTGPAVITKVLSHIELQGDPPTEVAVQDGYYAQDVIAGGRNLGGIKILTSDPQGGAVAAGARITALSGIMLEQEGGRVIVNPSVTIEGTASAVSVAMSQKSIYGPCVSQNLGSSFDTTSMMVEFFGRCVLSGYDPNWGTSGAYVFYIDDGSGARDGRELMDDVPVPGIRCLGDASDPLFNPPSVGDYLMVEGLVSYEHAVRSGEPYVDLGNVRTILFPTYTTLATGL